MSDLIDRQQTIEAICMETCGVSLKTERCMVHCTEVQAVEKLPPANCSEFPNNSDTISRQAVLALPIYKEKNLYGNIIREYVDIEDVKQLPPIQPEIIMCKECRYKERKGVDYYCDHITGEEIMVSPNDYCAWAERRTDE